jgi:DHA2 family multidrug resistance protein
MTATSTGEASSEDATLPPRQRLLVALAILPAGAMQGMDTFATGVAMPRMMGSLSATITEISWVLTAYLVASAMFVPLYAWLSRKVGCKRLFNIVVLGFIAASVMVSQSSNVTQLVVFRFVQGMFGAGLNPLSIQVVLRTFPTSHHGPAFGWLSTGRHSAVVGGPIVGGLLTELFDWRVVYLMNVPLGLLAFFLITVILPKDTPEEPKRFDFFGFLALSTAIAFIQLVLNRGEKLDWFDSQTIVGYTLIGAAAFYVFMLHATTTRNPYLNPRVFRNREFCIGVTFTFFTHFMIYGYAGLLPPILQNQLGMPVIEAGFVLMNRGLGTMFASLAAGALLLRFSARPIIGVGMAVVAISTGTLSTLTPTTSTLPIAFAILMQGIGLGMMSTAVMTAAFSTIEQSVRPDAASILITVRRVASSVGVSVMIATLVNHTQSARAALTENVSHYNERLHHFAMPEKWDLDSIEGMMSLDKVIERQAEFIAYLYDFQLMTVITLCSMPLLIFIRVKKKTA